MTEGGDIPAETRRRANSLYWGSDASVNRLAQELDLSKGALYDIIEPFPAGIPCPSGDGEMVYANRTARERGFVSCAGCGLEDEEEVVREHLEEVGIVPETAFPGRGASGGSGWALERIVVGSALAGAAVGFALARLLRRG